MPWENQGTPSPTKPPPGTKYSIVRRNGQVLYQPKVFRDDRGNTRETTQAEKDKAAARRELEGTYYTAEDLDRFERDGTDLTELANEVKGRPKDSTSVPTSIRTGGNTGGDRRPPKPTGGDPNNPHLVGEWYWEPRRNAWSFRVTGTKPGYNADGTQGTGNPGTGNPGTGTGGGSSERPGDLLGGGQGGGQGGNPADDQWRGGYSGSGGNQGGSTPGAPGNAANPGDFDPYFDRSGDFYNRRDDFRDALALNPMFRQGSNAIREFLDNLFPAISAQYLGRSVAAPDEVGTFRDYITQGETLGTGDWRGILDSIVQGVEGGAPRFNAPGFADQFGYILSGALGNRGQNPITARLRQGWLNDRMSAGRGADLNYSPLDDFIQNRAQYGI